ncbi:DUF397 domain-containing protein [Streptomyces sp. NPDC006654]|uniref:DUF397 domain-containing protein n=1 Tax=unclassified Streptomyces TaxID=2593676 RepID=UPI0033D15910
MTAFGTWRKSSYSGGGDGNNCLEIATDPSHISIRDSKHPTAGTLGFPAGVFVRFVVALKEEPFGDRRR